MKNERDIQDKKTAEEKRSEKAGKKEPTLEDVKPLHPFEYPAKGLKRRLDGRRDMLDDIEERGHPTGLPDGHGPLT